MLKKSFQTVYLYQYDHGETLREIDAELPDACQIFPAIVLIHIFGYSRRLAPNLGQSDSCPYSAATLLSQGHFQRCNG